MSHAGVEALFTQWDTDNSGFIEKSELQNAISNADCETVNEVLKNLDYDGDGRISLQELEKGLHGIIDKLPTSEPSYTSAKQSNLSTEVWETDMARRSSSCGNLDTMMDQDDSFENDEEDYRHSRRGSAVDEEFSSLRSYRRAKQLEDHLSQQDPRLLTKFRMFVNEISQKMKEQRMSINVLEQVYSREQLKQYELAIKMQEESESIAKDIEQKTRRKLVEKHESEKLEYLQEITALQDDLHRLQQQEQEAKEQVTLELDSLRTQLREMKADLKILTSEKLEAETSMLLAKNELVQLKRNTLDQQAEEIKEQGRLEDYVSIIDSLTKQVQHLQQMNKELQSANIVLNDEMEVLKVKDHGFFSEENLSDSTPSTSIPKIYARLEQSYSKVTLSEELKQAHLASSYRGSEGILYTDSSSYPTKRVEQWPPQSYDYIDTGKGVYSDLPEDHEDILNDKPKTQTVTYFHEKSYNPHGSENQPFQQHHRDNQKDNQWNGSTESMLSSCTQVSFKDIMAERLYKVIFAGDMSVGKTSFITHLCKGAFQPNTTASLGVDFFTKNIEVDKIKIALQLWDTAGQERFRCLSTPFFRKADGVVLMYDCCAERSFMSVREWVTTIRNVSDTEQLPIMICANKIDLRGEKEELGFKVISADMGEQLANECKTMFCELSAKTGEQLYSSINRLGRVMKEREDEGIKRHVGGLQLDTYDEPMKKRCNC